MVLTLMTGYLTLAQDLHAIVLEVNPQEKNLLSTLSLSLGDDARTGSGTSHDLFVVNAKVGDQIRWEGRSSPNAEGDVRITRIKYLGGPRIFSKDLISGKGFVQATVIRGGNTPYVYEIWFSLNNSSNEEVITSRIQILQ